MPGIVQALGKMKEKKRLVLEHSNKKDIHLKKKKGNYINAKTKRRKRSRYGPRA